MAVDVPELPVVEGLPFVCHWVDDGDLSTLRLDNGELSLVLLPGVGGRLVSLRGRRRGEPADAGAELLWRNPDYLDADLRPVRPRSTWAPLDGGMGSWANVGGSKTWPAPQGWSGPDEWPGPPDAVLDAGPWSTRAEAVGDTVVVTLTSPDDARTGLRVERAFRLPATGTRLHQRTTFTNVAAVPVRWAPWEVCQVDTASGAGLPLDRARVEVEVEPGEGTDAVPAAPLDMVRLVGEVESLGPFPGPTGGSRSAWHLPVADVVGKVGFTEASGRLAYVRPDGAGLELLFTPVPGATYPDGGARAELWFQCPLAEPLGGPGGLHPTAHLVELEVLAPLVAIDPGASVTQDLVWQVTPAGERA
ncbi:hypothetical protein N866_06745 [Actinotalea ferrariae CF5-4]|uniref:DUF4380 domain-containing protein n=1 Tax=Actinotalea ferrariae CF5-4 TaxID=948458 RepID=A0A021VN52_9CELL|nr:hypothetical protein [Actinotalea ferrariae]EYR62629.1 hypothetical protein N866_06745 [Actinotalea ferrariae CF5-4]